MIYQDRRDAGKRLAESVAAQPDLGGAIVLGLPRGGVPVAFEVAKALHAPLDVLVVRKLGVPGQAELAMGAITSDGTVVVNEMIVRELHIRAEVIEFVRRREIANAREREHIYREGRPPLQIDGRTVFLVDDGLATGATMRAAVRALRTRTRRLIVAVPVGAIEACIELSSEVDSLVCPSTPVHFGSVGQFYRDFQPTSDDEVRGLLAAAATLP